MKATHDGLAAAVQAVPVLSGDWTNDDDWQAIVGLALESLRVAMGG
ncbi:MAG: hypothetical protein HLUCCA11_23625 [Phormidesmis priestleyi Ana]|uniref:Uncharacterized protein n=1 Tax=Phormidesmis priestleyi Ana TaxID=1666911 RepID=A0A0P8D639_9CYAN|nr:MAG: hypothetical protein HLUCCA11_23625 [Phormidesmis priestleyi Ana]